MDSKSFDSWTRSRATTTNRRKMVGWSLATGVAAAISKVFPTSAQFGGSGDGTCTYDVTLTSSLTTGASVTGTLEIAIGQNGAIDSGSLTLQGQPSAAVVGQATGLAIDLLASLSDGTTVSLTGVSSSNVADCTGTILGILANAGTGQLGTWQAVSGPDSGTGSGSTAPPLSSGQSDSGSSSGSGSSGGSSDSGGSGGNNNGGGGSNTCPSPQIACGANCCPSGSSCMDANQGICGCPGGTTQCGTSCVPDCSGDEFLNLDTCQCEGNQEPACVDLGGGCANGGQCCGGWCNGGTCGSCGGIVCNDLCITDSLTNPNHCGGCNSPCIGTTCQNGSCQ